MYVEDYVIKVFCHLVKDSLIIIGESMVQETLDKYIADGVLVKNGNFYHAVLPHHFVHFVDRSVVAILTIVYDGTSMLLYDYENTEYKSDQLPQLVLPSTAGSSESK